jgi:hypothetical protein
MAYKRIQYDVTVAHTAVAVTVAQFLVAANERVVLKQVGIFPRGATGASAPMGWEWGTHDGAGTSSDDSAELVKLPPTFAGNILTTVRNVFTGEPVTFTPYTIVNLHQQNSLPVWVPPVDPWFMEAAERWAFKCVAPIDGVTVDYEFILEE